jgi:hypothetical protein
MRAGLIATFIVGIGFVGCAPKDEDVDAADGALVASGEAGGGDGIPSSFDKDRLMEDSFYAAKNWATGAEIQRFLEDTVWGRRSWLAEEKIVLLGDGPDGAPISIAEAIAKTAEAHGINPLLLLARMQVEKSLVSPGEAPSEAVRSFGLGCHKVTAEHPNGLDPSVASLNVQLECGAQTLETQLKKARAGQNQFTIDRDATTQDGVEIHPENAATSALYSYTPLEGTKAHNGNWLAWNVTFRFAAAIQKKRRA